MESKGGYVWDPEKKAWVRSTEPKAGEGVAGVSKPLAEAAEESKPVEAVAETKVEEASVEAVVETTVEEGAVQAEAETVSLDYLGALRRILAFIIDAVVLGIILLIAQAVTDWAQASLIAMFIYFIGFWAWRGQTLGKIVMRGRVVKADGSRAGFVRLIIRAIVFIAYFATTLLAGWLGVVLTIVLVFLIIGFTRSKRGPHDWIAGTCVVNTRSEALQPDMYEPSDISEATETGERANADEPETDEQE
jgi:uncharacterized RDD family membrane protein YckC